MQNPTDLRPLNADPLASAAPTALRWHPLHTQRKHEHIAAAHVSRVLGLEVFSPRIRYRRSTRVGPAWAVESLFPGYLFARFDPVASHRAVRAAAGVISIVHFGDRLATVPDDLIETLRAQVGPEEVHTIVPVLEPGMEVEVADGAFRGLRGILSRVMPARDRVKVLLEILGRTVETELRLPAVVSTMTHPLAA